ncbi:MAG: hypothetical protein AAF513_18960 [Pseudomonadota bacterium]
MKRLIPIGCALAIAGGCSDDSRRNYAPQFEQASLAVTVSENDRAVSGGLTATDRNGATPTYTLTGSDAAAFTFSGGDLQFASAPDFEAPSDADGDNVYAVEVVAADPQGLTGTMAVSVTVQNVNEMPVAEVPSTSYDIDENTAATLTAISAFDPDGDALTFSLSGPDAAHFSVTTDGVVAPTAALDFEAPLDADGDNSYAFTVDVSDSELDTSVDLMVRVADLDGIATAGLAATSQPRMFDVNWRLNDATPPGDRVEVMLDLNGDGNFVLAMTAALSDTTARVELPLIDQAPTLTTDVRVEVVDAQGDPLLSSNPMSLATTATAVDLIGYLKPQFSAEDLSFGQATAISGDGLTVVIGAGGDASDPAVGEQDGSLPDSGAVHVYNKGVNGWQRTAFLKGQEAGEEDEFGYAVAINEDGTQIVVGAPQDDGPSGNTPEQGAVHVFTLDQGAWSQTAFIFPSVSGGTQGFGRAVAISPDGQTIAVGAPFENQSAGAVYTFESNGGWLRHPRLQAPTAAASARFGDAVSLDATGSRLLVGAREFNVVQSAGAESQGAVFAYDRRVTTLERVLASPGPVAFRGLPPPAEWTLVNRIDAPNVEDRDYFGEHLALSADGTTAVIGALGEDSAAGAGPLTTDNSLPSVGGAYIARFDTGLELWTITDLLKPIDAQGDDYWGVSVAISASGDRVAIGGLGESSEAVGKICFLSS